jgi:nucleoside-diphosphate-sugar epimerase
MPRIIIAGCGYVGQAVADLCFAAGWQTEGWTASAESAAALVSKPYPVIDRDVSDADAVEAAPGQADVVLQCVSTRGGNAAAYRRVYYCGAENLLRRFPDATLIFTSSTGVYAQQAGEWVTEEDVAEPERETARILRETEELLLAQGGIVARLAGIYGPGRSFMFRKFLEGAATIDPQHDRFINQVHRDDAAAALFLLANRHADIGSGSRKIFNVVDDEPMTLSAAYRSIARQLERPQPPISETRRSGKRGESNKRVRNAKLRALGWAPRYPTFEAGLRESVIPQSRT